MMNRAGNIWVGLLMLTGLFLLIGCSPSGKSLLTFFFDGVPEPDSTELTVPGSDTVPADSVNLTMDNSPPGSPRVFVHYPYGEKECAACHDENSLGTMVEPQPALCYLCHEDLGTRYPYLHGPVAGGYCTSCHDPHISEKGKLLRFTGDQLCFYCHKEKSVYKNEMHEGLEGMACTDCHNPHGGEDKYVFQ